MLTFCTPIDSGRYYNNIEIVRGLGELAKRTIQVSAAFQSENTPRWLVARAFPPAPLKTESFRL